MYISDKEPGNLITDHCYSILNISIRHKMLVFNSKLFVKDSAYFKQQFP
jgi:hypothetical protein